MPVYPTVCVCVGGSGLPNLCQQCAIVVVLTVCVRAHLCEPMPAIAIDCVLAPTVRVCTDPRELMPIIASDCVHVPAVRVSESCNSSSAGCLCVCVLVRAS